MQQAWGYSPYNCFNRFENLDGIETKIIDHLVKSKTKHAEVFWKILKYDDLSALSQPSVSEQERWDLVCQDNGESTDKRVFLFPRDADVQVRQCSSVFIYVENITTIDHMRAAIGVTIDTAVYTKIGVISGDGDPDSSENPEWVNPNESDDQGSIVVPFKSRATTLLKSILAELNGIYVDGVGYMGLYDLTPQAPGRVDMPHNLKDKCHGHRISFKVEVSGVSDNGDKGF